MSGHALSDEADPLYRPIEPPGPSPVDGPAWTEAVATVDALRRDDPDRAAMAARGALLAAAFQSAVLDGVVAGDPALARALLQGQASLASLGAEARGHVRANLDALALAAGAGASEDTVRRAHALACGPQLTHEVLVEDRLQDHVMAHGDYKHHPNHLRLDGGGWRPTAPVAIVGAEMARLVALASGPDFAALHPAAQAGWLHDTLLHVSPFADGNGRVARALAGGVLLRAAGVPLVAFDGAGLDVVRAVVALVGLLPPAGAGALDAWRARTAVAADLRRRLVPALEAELRRPGAGRRADVSGAVVGHDLVVTVPGAGVEEALVIDAHPLDDGPVAVVAREAGARLVAGDPVEAFVERVVRTLALRVAAAAE